ncbi:MAG: NUDIX domain-containing protein [Erysipelotrichaceae bacterium]
MRLLFKIDLNNYQNCSYSLTRNCARSIIIKDNKLAMIHSQKYNFYKFPGGGIEDNETAVEACIRETREEAGLIIKPNSIKEYGLVFRILKSIKDEKQCYIQNNYYFLCDIEQEGILPKLEPYEQAEKDILEYVDAQTVIVANNRVEKSPYDITILQREAKVVELLLQEGLLK